MNYAIARKINGTEEYLYVDLEGADRFTSDINKALRYKNIEEVKCDLFDWEYFVKIDLEGLPQAVETNEPHSSVATAAES